MFGLEKLWRRFSADSEYEPRFKNDFLRADVVVETGAFDTSPFGEDTRFYEAPTEINQNLCRLRYGLGRIEDGLSYLEEALRLGPTSVAGQALIEAAYVKYASCFTDGKTSPNLNHDHLFTDDKDKRDHKKIIKIRDKFLVHSSEQALVWHSSIAVDAEAKIIDTPTWLVKNNKVFEKENVKSLHLLLAVAREELMEKLETKMRWAFERAQQADLANLNGPYTLEQLGERYSKGV